MKVVFASSQTSLVLLLLMEIVSPFMQVEGVSFKGHHKNCQVLEQRIFFEGEAKKERQKRTSVKKDSEEKRMAPGRDTAMGTTKKRP